jgi:hypothetical protein
MLCSCTSLGLSLGGDAAYNHDSTGQAGQISAALGKYARHEDLVNQTCEPLCWRGGRSETRASSSVVASCA